MPRSGLGQLDGVIMHTDHGSQYTSRAFATACAAAGVRQSMSKVGSSADNAAAESFNATRDLRGGSTARHVRRGQAVAVAHVAAHELGAAAYAIKAARVAVPEDAGEVARASRVPVAACPTPRGDSRPRT